MADAIPQSAPLACTANSSSTPCADSYNDCHSAKSGSETVFAARKQAEPEPDQPQQLLTPSVAIPLPPPPSLMDIRALEMPHGLPKTVESESQTDKLPEEISTSFDCSSATSRSALESNLNEAKELVLCEASMTNQRIQDRLRFEGKDALQPEAAAAPVASGMQLGDQQEQSGEVNQKFIDDPEVSLVQIHDKLIVRHGVETADESSESEEDDQLKPLMVDNHQECFLAKRQIQQIIQQNSALMKDLNNSSDSDRAYSDRPGALKPYNRPSYLLDSACDSSDIQSSDETTGKDRKSPTASQLPEGVLEIDALNPDEIPDDRTAEEISEQVEYYFSNENILKDAFLLKHVRRNKEGFVSLKLVSSFKRVRQYTKDWRVVGYAIRRNSQKIELNDLGTKIRRLEPLPTFDETMPSRTIVACDLPVDKLCIESVSDIFSKCGEIALIRILRPGTGIPVDVRQFMNKYPEMQSKECALVEFVESQAARNARNMDGPFTVLEMVAPKKKTGKKAIAVTKLIENYKYNDNNYERNRGGVLMSQPQPIESEFKYKLRRNNSEFYVKPDLGHLCTQRKYSYSPNSSSGGGNINHAGGTVYNHPHSVEPHSLMHYSRRPSNFSVASSENLSRKYSSCSEGYSSCSEFSRRFSGSSSSADSRRASNCSDYCPCSRRGSQCAGSIVGSPNMTLYNNDLLLRRMSALSTSSQHSGAGMGLEFTSDLGRRMSVDSNGGGGDRKMSTESNGNGDRAILHDSCRRFSNNFDPSRKLSNSDQYFNGRRLSTDSGYDRRMSFGSDYGSSPRSRSGSFLTCQHKNAEAVVRTPIGPDGSKGFVSRARKVGQTVSPV